MRRTRIIAALTLASAFGARAAEGQYVSPRVPELHHRSGLLTRSAPIIPHLPVDPDRDKFYDTYWADKAHDTHHVNSHKHSGLYGRVLKNGCTQCCSPYFQGKPGVSTLSPDCKPCHPAARHATNFVRPFQPVGGYYAGGCYVPIFDLDPWVTGPGPFPWPVFLNRLHGG